jgi:CBS domain-containing protein
MSEDVITVPVDTTLQGLALVLCENKISGAPVVDEQGHLIGVVSASDLVRRESQEPVYPRVTAAEDLGLSAEEPTGTNEEESDEDSGAGPTHPYFHRLDEADLVNLRTSFYPEDFGQALVYDVYTPHVITATPETPVAQLARIMVDHHIHRVLIVRGKKVVGIVSSMDVLKAVAHPRRDLASGRVPSKAPRQARPPAH